LCYFVSVISGVLIIERILLLHNPFLPDNLKEGIYIQFR
jgi:hypothetical protein